MFLLLLPSPCHCNRKQGPRQYTVLSFSIVTFFFLISERCRRGESVGRKSEMLLDYECFGDGITSCLKHHFRKNCIIETYKLPKLNDEEAESLNRPITASEIEAVIKKTPGTQKPWTRWLHTRMLPNIQRTPILLKLFQKIQEEGRLTNSFYKASIILIPKPGKNTTKKSTGQYP